MKKTEYKGFIIYYSNCYELDVKKDMIDAGNIIAFERIKLEDET